MTSLPSAVLLIAALVLAPIIAGGLGELAGGALQILIFLALFIRISPHKEGTRPWARVPGFWFLVSFALLVVLSTAQSRSIYFSLAQLSFLFACLGAYVLSATLSKDDRYAAGTLWAFVLSSLLVSGVAVQGYILDAGGGAGFWRALTSPGDHGRLFGPFVNPNFFSGFLVMALPVTLVLYMASRKALIAVLPALGFVFCLMALMLTGAKFGVIAASAAVVVFLLLAALTKSLDRRMLVRLLIITAVTIPILIPFSMPVKSRVEQAQAGGRQVHSTAFRLYTWKATLNMVREQPLLGVGPGTFAITYPEYTIAGPTKHAHNSYLQIAAEKGAPALIAFVLLLSAIAWAALKGMFARRSDDAAREPASESIIWADFVPQGTWRLVACGIFGALVGSSVRSVVDSDWSIIGISLPFWALAGLLVSRSGAPAESVSLGRVARAVSAAACVVFIAFGLSSAFGDLWATRADEAASARETEQVVALYSRAAAVSPLHPAYHRQLGLWLGLAAGDTARANAEIGRAIGLARNTSEGGWKARGMLAGAKNDWPAAIANLKTALKFNPNSTDTLNLLATAYKSSGHTRGYESILKRIISVEKSPYEQIKGTPEIVDTTYAFAHAYFGEQYLDRKRYEAAAAEFRAAVERLELWRASGDMRKLQTMMGMSNPQMDQSRLNLLRKCYAGLAEAYSALGRKADADKAIEKSWEVK